MRECGKCGKQTENQTVTITLGAETRAVVLCDTHLKPIQALFRIGHAGPNADRAAPTSGRRGHAVIPVD